MIRNRSVQAELKDRWNNNVLQLVGSGAPTSGASGTGSNVGAGPGSSYSDYTNGVVYTNIGTAALPIWLSAQEGRGYLGRYRKTIAEVNAGATLLSALPGWKYRLHDAAMISIGGAVGAADTVDILGTQSASGVKLLAVAIAALTQNALVRAGAANATILAGGVSFVDNDVNTAITIGKTGATATTATHVDFLISFALTRA